MKTGDNFRKRVMKYAWQLFRTTGQMWSTCMRKAWQLWRLSKAMKEGVCTFYYQKVSGSIRKAVGTMKGMRGSVGGRRLTKPCWKTMVYFDLEKNAYRCFRLENFICMA